MINNFIDEIAKQIQKDYKYVTEYMISRCFISMLVLKYYCDNSIYSYQEIINSPELKEISFPLDDLTVKIGPIKYPKLLAFIQYENLQDMVKEYLTDKNIGIDLINNDEKKLCITNKLDEEIYDLKGNTTYIIDKLEISIKDVALFKFFDKVLGINNQYLKYDEIKKTDYNYLYIYDNTPRYRFIRNSENDVYYLIRRILYDNDKLTIILHTDFKKVSNMKEFRYLVKYLSKIVLYDDEKTFLYFQTKDNDQVSIINYNHNKIKSVDQLHQIINNDRKQKDILVKTTVKDIQNNYYRIGFKLYQNKTINDARNINEIVDENTRLIEKLSHINENIEQEINKLINR